MGIVIFTNGLVVEFHMDDYFERDIKNTSYSDAGIIKSIQLDGRELAHVMDTFSNIPINKNRKVQSWRGDIAKFIIENW